MVFGHVTLPKFWCRADCLINCGFGIMVERAVSYPLCSLEGHDPCSCFWAMLAARWRRRCLSRRRLRKRGSFSDWLKYLDDGWRTPHWGRFRLAVLLTFDPSAADSSALISDASTRSNVVLELERSHGLTRLIGSLFRSTWILVSKCFTDYRRSPFRSCSWVWNQFELGRRPDISVQLSH